MTGGITLGILTFLTALVLFVKFPEKLRYWLYKHHLFADLVASIMTYLLLTSVSGSYAALVAASVVGLLVSAGLWIGRYGVWR